MQIKKGDRRSLQYDYDVKKGKKGLSEDLQSLLR